MCCKLFEKVYSVFISHLKTKIYPNLARVISDIPKPLSEDDLDFNEQQEYEDEKHEENSKTFEDKLTAWKLANIDEMFTNFIPAAVKDFNTGFEDI